jgi:hypothetical protein
MTAVAVKAAGSIIETHTKSVDVDMMMMMMALVMMIIQTKTTIPRLINVIDTRALFARKNRIHESARIGNPIPSPIKRTKRTRKKRRRDTRRDATRMNRLDAHVGTKRNCIQWVNHWDNLHAL